MRDGAGEEGRRKCEKESERLRKTETKREKMGGEEGARER